MLNSTGFTLIHLEEGFVVSKGNKGFLVALLFISNFCLLAVFKQIWQKDMSLQENIFFTASVKVADCMGEGKN